MGRLAFKDPGLGRWRAFRIAAGARCRESLVQAGLTRITSSPGCAAAAARSPPSAVECRWRNVRPPQRRCGLLNYSERVVRASVEKLPRSTGRFGGLFVPNRSPRCLLSLRRWKLRSRADSELLSSHPREMFYHLTSICCSSLGLSHICCSPGTAPVSSACREEAESQLEKLCAVGSLSRPQGALAWVCAATESPSHVSAVPEMALSLAASEISNCWRLDPPLLPLIPSVLLAPALRFPLMAPFSQVMDSGT